MYKNMFKRAALSVRRKISRTVIIALTFFVISNLILGAIIIKSAVSESMTNAKATLEATVSLQADMEKLRENFSANGSAPSASGSSQGASGNPVKGFVRPSAMKSIADQIAISDFVKDYSYSVSASANSDSLSAVETTTEMPMRGGNGSMGGTTGDFSIIGVNSYAYIDGVKSDQITISDGKYFDESTPNSIIVSVDLAEENSLKVGDKVKLTNVYDSKNYTLEIIGIYENSSNFANANMLYMNVETAADFLNPETKSGEDFAVENPTFILKNAEDASDFIAWIETGFPELAEQNIVAKENTALYDQMVGPIENVGSFANVVLILAIVAGAAIIMLVVLIDVKDRRYEMGVLLSLGSNKFTIVGQIFTELALVSFAIFALSSFTATAFANALGQGILDSQITATTASVENNFGRGGNHPDGFAGGKGAGMANGQMANTQSPNQNAISEINVNARPQDFLALVACEILLILVSLVAPACTILRFEPKQILQGKE